MVTAGDFNADGKRDWAALVTADGKKIVAVCLSAGRGKKRVISIENALP